MNYYEKFKSKMLKINIIVILIYFLIKKYNKVNIGGKMLDILNKINHPSDLNDLSIDNLEKLSEEIREVLLQKLSKNGGHFGPNFGMVEAIIAMHYVFESPKDKFVFDVSHQSYAHKILTGSIRRIKLRGF